ncbi:MAG: LL-diaminopimelate aminotransferase [Ruminococcus sp.]|nr:LL-diaminopimelate aminotransferase [Ruminococcus sp.]
MVKINENFLSMEKNYLFIDIAKKVKAFTEAHPDKPLIRMGIGDVTLPLAPVVVEAIKKAADEMGVKETFRGYEDSGAGYDFLRKAIADYYGSFGVSLNVSDIRVNDGAKSDCGNITDIFGDGNTVLVTDPAYPVYVDSNVMAGRKPIYADSNEENGFAAMPCSSVHADIIYLCSPNNPTGSVYTKEQLAEWVDYALANEAVIIFDSAYEAFISDPALPRSIYAVPDAKKCAIEMCSLSKTAGFTGTRCGYTVIPEELTVKASDGSTVRLADIWGRRQGSKFNGVSYPIQRGAEAVFTPEGQRQTREAIDYYRKNARLMADTLTSLEIKFTGGINSPYVWLKCPNGMGSWEFFDFLLDKIQVVGTPGEGFGKNGKGWFRLTAFNTYENTAEAMNRLKTLISNM